MNKNYIYKTKYKKHWLESRRQKQKYLKEENNKEANIWKKRITRMIFHFYMAFSHKADPEDVVVICLLNQMTGFDMTKKAEREEP